MPRSTKFSIFSPSPHDAEESAGLALKVGELNLRVMELLDKANTEAYGHPVPTPVRVHRVKGKAILVSGHDLERPRRAAQADRRQGHQRLHPRRDAALPRLSRAEEVQAPRGQLRRRLAGPGEGVRRLPRRHPDDDQLHPEAADSYKDRIFTSGLVAWPGVRHIGDREFPAGDRRPPWPRRASPKTARRRRSSSALATTPCWAWPTR